MRCNPGRYRPRRGTDSKGHWCLFSLSGTACLIWPSTLEVWLATLEPWATYIHHALVTGLVTALAGNSDYSVSHPPHRPIALTGPNSACRWRCHPHSHQPPKPPHCPDRPPHQSTFMPPPPSPPSLQDSTPHKYPNCFGEGWLGIDHPKNVVFVRRLFGKKPLLNLVKILLKRPLCLLLHLGYCLLILTL